MANAAEQQNLRVEPVGVVMHLARRARQAATAAELGFIAVNETHALMPYRQAALWFAKSGVTALSGVVTPEANAPFVLWLDRVAAQLAKLNLQQITTIDPTMLKAEEAAEWEEWLPAHALWLPLEEGGLILARDEAWPERVPLLAEWLEIWQHAWTAKHRPAPAAWFKSWLRKPRIAKRYVFIALAITVIPVRLTVLVPGELSPATPATVRAPLEGTVDQFFVQPNQPVKAGAPLFQLDLTTLTSKLNVARQDLATAEAEYRQTAQQAVFDARSKAMLGTLQGRIAEHATEVRYLQSQLARAQVTAPRDGIVLVDDPSEWIGKPVTIGERVLTIADEHDVEVEAWLSPADAIDLPDGASVTLYLNAAPLRPVHATLRYVAHEAIARPDGNFAYRLRATIEGKEDRPRVGLKGTVRVSGHYVPLIYWVMRRPLATIRPWIGW